MRSTDRPPRRPARSRGPLAAGALALAAALAGLSACGDGAPPAPATTASSTTTLTGPPPATVRGPAGTVTMAGFGGCWRESPGGPDACGDPAWPTCPDPALPAVPVSPGDTLTFRLATAEPAAVSLRTGAGTTPITLPAGTEARWRVTGAPGPLVLRAEVPGRGDPAWAACLVPAG